MDRKRLACIVVAIVVVAVCVVELWPPVTQSPGVPRPTDRAGVPQEPGRPVVRELLVGASAPKRSDTFVVRAVVVTDGETPCSNVEFSLASEHGWPGTLTFVATREDGSFESAPLRRGTWLLRVRTAGWSFEEGHDPIIQPPKDGEYIELRITMTKETALLKGVVRTAAGMPLKSAQVAASGSGLLMTATTDESGRFQMVPSAMSPGRTVEGVDVLIGANDGCHFAGLWPLSETEYEFVLPRPCYLVVRLTDWQGRPVERFSARLISLTQHGIPQMVISSGAVKAQASVSPMATTATGDLPFEELRPGRYLVACFRGTGDAETLEAVEVGAAEQRTVVVRERRTELVRVRNAVDDSPILEATVSVGALLIGNANTGFWVATDQLNAQTANMPGGVVAKRYEVKTDAKGEVTLPCPEPSSGDYLLVRARGYATVCVALADVRDRTVRLNKVQQVSGMIVGWEFCKVTLDLQEATAFARHVMDRSVVFPSRDGQLQEAAEAVRDDGGFAIPGVPPGNWELLIAARNNRVVLGTFEVPMQTGLVMDVTKYGYGRVAFVVEARRPVTNVSVGIYTDAAMSYPSRWLPARDGRTDRVGLVAGHVRVEVRTSDSPFGRGWVTEVEVGESEDQVVTLPITYQEAIIEVPPEEEKAMFAVTEERDKRSGPADFRMRAKNGKVRVRWAPQRPFWVMARHPNDNGKETVYGPYSLGAAETTTFQARR